MNTPELPFRILFSLWIGALVSLQLPAHAQSSQPRLFINQLEYEGAFRLSADSFGDSELNYSEGPIAYNPDNHSLFIVGHSYHQAIAEFDIPALVNSNSLSDLNMVSTPRQVFRSVLDVVSGGNTEDIDRIGGMHYVVGGMGAELLVNAYEYYDAPADNSDSTLVIRDANDLAGSTIDGYFQFSGNAAHLSGWISPVPPEWQSLLGGDFITGHSSGIPIIGRASVGPSAFVFDPFDIVGQAIVNSPVAVTTLLDFSLDNPLHEDLSNESGTNKLWTHLSRAVYGLIVPGTRTYLTVGYSGGHKSGVCYKCEQSNGNTCGGYCAPNANDYSPYYWLWDVNDLVSVKQGALQSHEVSPYAYGALSIPFPVDEIGGGTFDKDNGILYLSAQRADTEQGDYANPPVVMAYSFNLDAEPAIRIGKAGRRTLQCLIENSPVQCRIDSGESTGDAVSAIRCVTAAKRRKQKLLNKLDPDSAKYRKKLRAARRTLSRARMCRRGAL